MIASFQRNNRENNQNESVDNEKFHSMNKNIDCKNFHQSTMFHEEFQCNDLHYHLLNVRLKYKIPIVDSKNIEHLNVMNRKEKLVFV